MWGIWALLWAFEQVGVGLDSGWIGRLGIEGKARGALQTVSELACLTRGRIGGGYGKLGTLYMPCLQDGAEVLFVHTSQWYP